jgi:uncharacterized membrane protein YebE (DUF533 family)
MIVWKRGLTMTKHVEANLQKLMLLAFKKSRKSTLKIVKIGHINANSIAGFKLYEIKQWLTTRLI